MTLQKEIEKLKEKELSLDQRIDDLLKLLSITFIINMYSLFQALKLGRSYSLTKIFVSREIWHLQSLL